jgi:hypothetical protein
MANISFPKMEEYLRLMHPNLGFTPFVYVGDDGFLSCIFIFFNYTFLIISFSTLMAFDILNICARF